MLLHLLHQLRMACPLNLFFFGSTVEFGMSIETALDIVLLFLHGDAVRVGPCVLTDSGDLPRYFHPGAAAADSELVVGEFFSDVDRGKSANASELIAEVAVEYTEPLRHLNDGLAVRIERCHTVINVLHVGRLDEGVVEIFVSRIERMVNLERPPIFGKVAVDENVASKIAGQAAARVGINAITTCKVGTSLKNTSRPVVESIGRETAPTRDPRATLSTVTYDSISISIGYVYA